MFPNKRIPGAMVRILLSVALLAGQVILAPAQLPAQSTDGSNAAAQIDSRLANVRRLLETSSGAKRVLAGNDPLALKIREDAVRRYQEAEQAHQSGDEETANRLLTEATQTMFQAIRVLGPPQEVTNKKLGDFEGRAESTRVLLEALQRIAADEGKEGKIANTVATVEKAMGMAHSLLEQGNVNQARVLMDVGYETAKLAVEGLRDGRTLVRTLNFSSKEEEYRYELDRNDTHHMLVTVVLKDNRPGAQSQSVIDANLERAGQLRRDAEAKADDGEYPAAIQLLELSTKELVRAIRGAGVYIPG